MTNRLTPSSLEPLHAAMSARVDRGEVPGLVLLVSHGDEVWVDTIGYTGFGRGAPMARDTIFRIASMTKPMLAAVALSLVEDGTIALDAPVGRWLPELAEPRVLQQIDGPLDETVPAARAITVEDLLTFRMGSGMLTEPTFDPPFPIVRAGRERRLVLSEPDPRTPHGPDEWMRLFGELPLMCQPGERWMYNTSAIVLGVLVARAGGGSLGDVMHNRLFGPLGMATTGFWLPSEQLTGLPPYHLKNPETGNFSEPEVSPAEEWSRPPVFPSGAAGLLSTVDDVHAFGRMLRGGGELDGTRVLSERSVAALTTNHLTPEQITGGGVLLSGSGWGYGMAVTVAPDEVSPAPGRYGWSGGYGTSWCNDPATGRTLVILSQVSDVLWNGTLTEFNQLALRE
jgi:CubicO group peptidase (beta-lactamase class C family)